MFRTTRAQVRVLDEDELPQVQALFETNPGYFLRVGGLPPRPDEARQEFEELPPPHLGFTRRWFAGIRGADDDALRGVIVLLSDLGAPGVWHIALFLLADAWHGSGLAAEVHDGLVDFARAQGARWLRLGVVRGNLRAQRFWTRQGYIEVRERAVPMADGQVRAVAVCVRDLAGDGLSRYGALVPRDHPGSTLP